MAAKVTHLASSQVEKPAPKQVSFDDLADSALVRESQLVPQREGRGQPGTLPPLPFSSSTLWRLVKAGKFPAPIKLSEKITAWKVGDVRQWLAAQQTGSAA